MDSPSLFDVVQLNLSSRLDRNQDKKEWKLKIESTLRCTETNKR